MLLDVSHLFAWLPKHLHSLRAVLRDAVLEPVSFITRIEEELISELDQPEHMQSRN